jgi:hypothetical protein
MLRHYVFLKFRDDTSDGHLTEFCERMLAVRGAIAGIEHLEIGRDELHDDRSWDLVLIMEFASIEALRAYQRHPQHLALMAFNAPFAADVATVDFSRAQSRPADRVSSGR